MKHIPKPDIFAPEKKARTERGNYARKWCNNLHSLFDCAGMPESMYVKAAVVPYLGLDHGDLYKQYKSSRSQPNEPVTWTEFCSMVESYYTIGDTQQRYTPDFPQLPAPCAESQPLVRFADAVVTASQPTPVIIGAITSSGTQSVDATAPDGHVPSSVPAKPPGGVALNVIRSEFEANSAAMWTYTYC
jgi:hypothetical protein